MRFPNAFPLSSVISTTAYCAAVKANPDLFAASVLLTVAPQPGSTFETTILHALKRGSRVLLYSNYPLHGRCRGGVRLLRRPEKGYSEVRGATGTLMFARE